MLAKQGTRDILFNILSSIPHEYTGWEESKEISISAPDAIEESSESVDCNWWRATLDLEESEKWINEAQLRKEGWSPSSPVADNKILQDKDQSGRI